MSQLLVQAAQRLKRSPQSVIETALVKAGACDDEVDIEDIAETIFDEFKRKGTVPNFVTVFCSNIIRGQIKIVRPKAVA